jgi:hypothetical protein
MIGPGPIGRGMTIRVIAVFAAMTLAGSGVAAAQPAAPDPATLAAARQMLRVVDIPAQMHALGPRLGETVVRAMQQEFGDNQVPDGLSREITAALQQFVGSVDGAFTPQVIDQIAAIYARHFSRDDLERLSTMLADPVMQRFRAETPDIVGDETPIILAAMRPMQAAFEARVKQIVADWLRDHPEDKSKLVHPNVS